MKHEALAGPFQMSNSRLLEVYSTAEVSFVVSEFDDVFQNGIP
jgi:hypothetical protein